MTTAVKPLTLFNNTTADANDVEAIVNVLYATVNGLLDSANLNLGADFNFTGNLQVNGLETNRVLARVSAIDGKVVGATSLLTVPAGKTAVITGAVVRLTTATAISGTLVAGIGVAAGEDDIIPPTSMIGLNATGENFKFAIGGVSVEAAATQVIRFGIDTAFGGTTATLEVELMGYYK